MRNLRRQRDAQALCSSWHLLFTWYCWRSKFITKIKTWRHTHFRYTLFRSPRFNFWCTGGAWHERATNLSCPVLEFFRAILVHNKSILSTFYQLTENRPICGRILSCTWHTLCWSIGPIKKIPYQKNIKTTIVNIR